MTLLGVTDKNAKCLCLSFDLNDKDFNIFRLGHVKRHGDVTRRDLKLKFSKYVVGNDVGKRMPKADSYFQFRYTRFYYWNTATSQRIVSYRIVSYIIAVKST